MILTIGLSVDYSLHIAHGFLTSSGSKRQRAASTLEGLGVSVFNGGTATFLAVATLGASATQMRCLRCNVACCGVMLMSLMCCTTV
jgi:hypothetical protein